MMTFRDAPPRLENGGGGDFTTYEISARSLAPSRRKEADAAAIETSCGFPLGSAKLWAEEEGCPRKRTSARGGWGVGGVTRAAGHRQPRRFPLRNPQAAVSAGGRGAPPWATVQKCIFIFVE